MAMKQLSSGSNIFGEIAAEPRGWKPTKTQVGPGNVLSTLTSKCVRGPSGPMKRADMGWNTFLETMENCVLNPGSDLHSCWIFHMLIYFLASHGMGDLQNSLASHGCSCPARLPGCQGSGLLDKLRLEKLFTNISGCHQLTTHVSIRNYIHSSTFHQFTFH